MWLYQISRQILQLNPFARRISGAERRRRVRLAFDRAMKTAGMDTDEAKDKRRFEVFRDTGANTIEQEFQEYPHLSSLYLAHKETAMKGKYVSRHFDLLFKALDRLDTVFALRI